MPKFDEKIQKLLDGGDSEYDNVSDISIGSGKKNNDEKSTKSVKSNKSNGNSSAKSSKGKKPDITDFGVISVGSKNKGDKTVINVGKKK